MTKTRKILGIVLALIVLTLAMSMSIFAQDTENVVLPDGITAESFGNNTVTDGTNFYTTIKSALEGIHLTDNRVLYCKPGADVGVMTHGHVCANLIVYGNGAYLTASGEQDFELDTYKFCHNGAKTCNGVTGELTLTVKNLNGCGAWGQRATSNTVNIVFENCKDMNRVYINGTSGINNITLINCSFLGSIENRCTLYSNANGTVKVSGCVFENIFAPINLNHKVAGTQTIVIENTTFNTCGTAEYDYAAPVRVLSSVEGAESALKVSGCTFANTVANKNGQDADILLDYGVGSTNASVSSTSANVTLEKENNVGSTTVVASTDNKSFSNVEVAYAATVNGVGYATLADALAAAKAMTGDVVVEILGKVTLNTGLAGSYDSIKFVGKTETAEIYLDLQGYSEATGEKVAFEKLKLSKVEGGYIPNAGFMNLAFGVFNPVKVTYTNCTFLNGAYASYGEAVFTGCTFYRSYDRYSLWVYDQIDVTVDGCTFADIRGIKMYSEGKFAEANLTVKNTNFSAVDGKPAIVLTHGNSVTLENNTYNPSKGVFELDLDGKPNGVTVTSDVYPTCVNDNGPCGVLVDGKIYTTVAQAAAVAVEGSKVTLLHNSTETVELAEGVTLNKNGYTADGVTVKVAKPMGTLTNVYTSADGYWGECGGNAKESFGFKFYNGDTYMGSTFLNNVGGIIDGDVYVSWSLKLDAASNKDEYWKMEWAIAPTIEMQPTRVEQWVDGVKVADAVVEPNWSDKIFPVIAAVTDADGKILSYVNNTQGATLQDAIKAAPSGRVELLCDVTVDKWIMISETLTIGNGTVITLDLNGLTIDGNGHTLTINSVESANNGNHIFYDGDYNLCDLTVVMGANVNGFGITSGTISNVTFVGGRGISAGAAIHVNDGLISNVHAGKVTIDGCTFQNNGMAIYFETAQNGLVVNNNTFKVPSDANVIMLRGTEQFTNNTVVSGRTVNVVSGSPVVTGNNFGDVRLKVYNVATATVSNNTINNLVFNDETVAQSVFADNTLSAGAQAALDAVTAVYVAEVNGVGYATLAEALAAANDGDTITLIWAEGDAPIAMNGSVYGKSVTITGTALVDWSKGFLFIGRGGEGNGTVIFDNANLTSASNNSATGIHVSGRERDTNDKYNGTLEIKNSTIELDYLINKGTMTLNNSDLTVKNGFAIGGRPASETESGADATATITLNASKVVVNNHNGMGLGYEAIGVMNVNSGSTFECTQDFLVTLKGTMNVNGGAIKVAGKLTNNGKVNLTDVDLTDITIDGTGTTYFSGDVNFYGNNNVLSGINGSDFELIVNKGATLLISRFVLGYNRNITVYGEIEDAHAFDPTGKTPSLKFNSTSGVSVGGTGTGNLTVKDAYIELDNSSWKNAYGTYTWSFENSYVSATSFTNSAAPASTAAEWTVTFDDSVLAAKNYIKNGVNTTYNFVNGSVATTGSLRIDGTLYIDSTSSVTTTSQQNNVVGKVDEHGGINGTVIVDGALTIGSNSKTQLEMLGGKLTVGEDGKVALGENSLTLDAASTLEIDVTGMQKDETYEKIEGTVVNNGAIIVNSDKLLAEVVDGKIVLTFKPVAMIGTQGFETLEEAFAAAKANDTIDILMDTVIDYKWDCRYTGSSFNVPVTINGNNHTIKFTGSISDPNTKAAFIFKEAATIKNLTIDVSESDAQRVVASKLSITVDNCKFIGNGTTKYGVIFGEGAGTAISNVTATITNTKFYNFNKAISDNANAQDAKSVAITDCYFENGDVNVSANTSITFNGNEMVSSYVKMTTYTSKKLTVTAQNNTIDAEGLKDSFIKAVYVNAQADIPTYFIHVGSLSAAYTSSNAIWGECGGNAHKSFVLEIYDQNGNLMGYTSLNNIGGIINGNVNVTWNINLNPSNTDEYWTMVWNVAPSVANVPTTVKQVVDGTVVAQVPVQLNGPDGLNKIYAATTDANGNITKYHTSLNDAIANANSNDVIVLRDVTESIASIENVKLVSGSANGVTITNTCTDWVSVTNLTLGNGITLHMDNALMDDEGVNVIEGTLNIDTTFYHAYDSKTTIQNGGKLVTGGMIVVRYNYKADSGLYVYGDNNDSTVEVSCANTIGTYSGTFYVKDAVVNANQVWLDYHKSETDRENVKYAQLNATFDNSTVNVTAEIKFYADSTLTLIGSDVTAKEVQIRANSTPVVRMDANSTVKANSVLNLAGATLNAFLGADGTVSFAVVGLAGSGTEADPFLITSLEDLIWFRDQVDLQLADGSTQFAGKYFKLTADIDLAGINWNPIGSMTGDHGSFKGVFDGGNHTISNLNVQQAGNGIGLFARTTGNAVIKNLKLNNVTVKSTDNSNYVGGLVGNAYASTKIENVHVTGTIDISGRGYIGGIAGHGYVVMDNVSVVGTTGTIYSTFWCAGGILGYGGEGSTNIMNAHVEGITITSAAGGLGAIVGMAEDNKGTQPISGSNLSAKDVVVKTFVGAYGTAYSDYALGVLYGGNPTSNLTGTLTAENVKVETSTGAAPTIVDAVATVNGAYYFSIQEAFAALKSGDALTIYQAGTYNVPTGKNLTITGAVDGVVFDNIGACGMGGASVTFNNVTFDYYPNVNYTGLQHSGNLVYNNCTFNGQVFLYGVSETFNKCIFNQNSADAYNVWTYSAKEVAFNECIFNCAGKAVLVYHENASVTNNVAIADSKFIASAAVDGKAAIEIDTSLSGGANITIDAATTATGFGSGNVSGNSLWNNKKGNNTDANNDVTVVVGGEAVLAPVTFVAKIGNIGYTSLADAIAAIGSGDVVIDLVADATLDYNAREAYGLAETTSVTINGNGHTLKLNQKNSDWASIGLANAGAKLVLNNMTIEKTGYGATSGAWNTHAIIFKCNVEMTDVTVINSVAVQNGATLNNVTINEANGYYGLWINANGQTVTMTGGEINATNGGRGIKIADQYVDNVKQVKLDITGTKFTTAKKAAVLVSSTEGAEITVSGIDISGVAEDKVNAVWVDEDWSANYGKVTVTGATVAQENVSTFAAAITSNGNVVGYYKTIADAIAAANAGDTITLIRDITSSSIITIDKSITLDGNDKKLTYTGAARAIDVPNTVANANVTIKNLTIDFTSGYSERGINYNTNGTLTLDNVTINGEDVTYAVNFAGSSNDATVVINNSNIIGKIALNVWGKNMTITVTDTALTSVDPSAAENYAAVKLNNNGSVSAEKTVITINGGTITALDENGNLSSAATNATATGEIIISDTTTVTGNINTCVAIVTYNGYSEFYSCFTLQAAIDKAANDANATVKLLRDVTVNEALVINGDVVIDLNGKKVTSTAKKAFEVHADATIKNGTIVGANRCVNTREAVKLTLADLTLVAENYTSYGNPQPLTIGGSVDGTVVTMSYVNINAGKSGYGIISFVQTNLTATNSTISGYSALYVKAGSENSVFTFNNCTLTGDNTNNDVEGNSFAAIALETNNITVTVDANSTINANGNYMAAIAVGSTSIDATGNTVTVSGTIKGNIIATDDFDNTVKVKAEYADELVNAGYGASAADTNGLVTVEKRELTNIVWKDITLSLDSDLKINFYLVSSSLVEGYNYYARVIIHHDTGCNENALCQVRYIPMNEWLDNNNGIFKKIAVDGLAAKDMACKVEVQIFVGETPVNAEIEHESATIEVPANSQVVSTIGKLSILDYCKLMFSRTDAEAEEVKPLLADLLVYGASAQKFFGHYILDENNNPVYVTNGMDEIIKKYATGVTKTVENNVKWLTGDQKYYNNFALTLETTIYLNFYFDSLTAAGTGIEDFDINKIQAHASFTHYQGKVHDVVYSLNDGISLVYDKDGNVIEGMVKVIIEDIAPADLFDRVTIELVYGDQVLAGYETSAEDYCAHVLKNINDYQKPEELKEVMNAILAFAEEAERYFSK